MLLFEEALEIVLNSARPLGAERVRLANAADRVLAEDVKSDMDMPPFNKSAMDGYACRRSDLANELVVIETIPAGHSPAKSVGPNQCSKIMTGGVVPEGADCVVMKEYIESPRPNVVRFVGEETKDNICLKGEDAKAGDIVLQKGTLLKPQHIAVLASVGQARPLVSKMPRVGIIATGSELVDPSALPQPSQIRNSNSFQLVAQAGRVGVPVTDYGVTADTKEAIDTMFRKVAGDNDLVILSGGVSVGDFDFVPDILRRNKIDLLFEGIAVKPGKPSVFGVSDDVYCFGLPGNPMSTYVQFEILIKPFLYRLMGCEHAQHGVRMPLDQDIRRKKTERQAWLPVSVTDAGTVKLVEYHGSAHISSLCSADGLINIDVGVALLKKGMVVDVRLI
ncbi:MAG: molybdopterin molybdotransferase MoeA [Phycisphaerales bacterium]|nr:MAG: molybdopterin molybdotransferase MoeA [Phycisphaerales bacterium]